MTNELIPFDYLAFLLAVNRELMLLYWQSGRAILERQKEQGWGAKGIDQLSRDLHTAFPEMKGFSPQILKYMRSFAHTYSDEQFVQQPAAHIPWFHHCILLDKVQECSFFRPSLKNPSCITGMRGECPLQQARNPS